MTHVEWKKVTEFSKPCLGDMLADWTEERDKLIDALESTVDGIEAIESDRACYSEREMEAQIYYDKILLKGMKSLDKQ